MTVDNEVPLSELYQEMILDHNRNPKNFKKLESHNRYAHGYNPLCGDDYEVFLFVDDTGTIRDVGFLGSGCAISKASASVMTSMIKGKQLGPIQNLARGFVGMITEDKTPTLQAADMKRLGVFEGVKRFPIRVKCATLAWHALEDALAGSGKARGMKEKE